MEITEGRAAELAQMIEDDKITFGDPLPRDQWPARGRGRPSLSNARGKSPQVTVRISPELHVVLTAEAEKAGVTVSDLTRQALEEFVSRPHRKRRRRSIASTTTV